MNKCGGVDVNNPEFIRKFRDFIYFFLGVGVGGLIVLLYVVIQSS